MADSTTACFTSLLENIPAWVAEVEDILKSAAVKQEEILLANRPSTPPRQDGQARSFQSQWSRDRNKRCGSSIRLNPLHPSLPQPTNTDVLSSSQRKRKTASVLSDQGSGPAAVRRKTAAVIYYDGDTQKRLEKVVRDIGLSRNAIRKGKMSAKVDSLSRTGSSSGSDGSGEDLDCHKLNYQPTRPSPALSRNDGTEVYNNVDSEMEKAQGFCERAAYQILKDGDCALEVSHAKEHFARALQIAEAELPALKKKANKVVERQRRSDERRRAEEESATRRAATALALKARLQATVAVDSVTSSETTLEVDQLEVDDSDSESESDGEFNVTDLKSGRLLQMRGARLAAAH